MRRQRGRDSGGGLPGRRAPAPRAPRLRSRSAWLQRLSAAEASAVLAVTLAVVLALTGLLYVRSQASRLRITSDTRLDLVPDAFSTCVMSQWRTNASCRQVCSRMSADTILTSLPDIAELSAVVEPVCHKCSGWNSLPDAIWTYIGSWHAKEPFTTVLDAGTGPGSAAFLAGLNPAPSIVAVTAADTMASSTRSAAGPALSELVVGHWSDETLLRNRRFHTVLADYLVGAIDHFDAYTQDALFGRLFRHVDQRLFVVGYEPLPPTSGSSLAYADVGVLELIRRTGQLRDVCSLLAGRPPYREMPLRWYLQALRRAGFVVVAVRRFPVVYGPRWVHAQLDMGRAWLQQAFAGAEAVAAIRREMKALQQHANRRDDLRNGVCLGMDFVIVAEPAPSGTA